MSNYLDFFKTHERLVLVLSVLGALLWAHLAWVGYRDRRDLREQGAAHERLQSDAAVAQARLDQARQDAQDVKQLLAVSEARVTALEGAILARDQQVSKQQTQDRSLAPDQLAARIQTLAPGGTVTVTADQGYRLDRPEAELVAAQLELVDPLQADVRDLRGQVTEKERQVTGLQGQVTNLQGATDALQRELTDTGYVPDQKGNLACRGGQCQADVKVARDAEARKHRKLEVILTLAGYLLGRGRL